jgi:hydroxyacylglutathione hydrolase
MQADLDPMPESVADNFNNLRYIGLPSRFLFPRPFRRLVLTTSFHTDHSGDTARFYQMHLGGDRNFTYLMGDVATKEAAVVDPGFDPDRIKEIAEQSGLHIRHILITHGHGDHTAGVARLQELTGAICYAGPEDNVPDAQPLADNQEVRLGDLSIQALRTPGHSPGHFCFLFEDRLITGDLLFCGKIGGTGDYFPGSSAEAEFASLARLMQLPDETGVFPGHDYYGGEGTMPHSTIGHERRTNPFLTVSDFDAFIHLKDNWAQYKKDHGVR